MPDESDDASGPLTYESLRQALDAQPLFENKTWRLSPEPWPLTRKQVAELEAIGQACYEFYRAIELLYTRSHEGRNLLRNKPLKAPWVTEYLDRGKISGLVEHARSDRNRNVAPIVMRPDLLITEDGFAMSELDSVPGGIGLTAFLNRLYEKAGFTNIIGANDKMIRAFYEALSALAPAKSLPLIAILVSEEAATYRPEMRWLAEQLQRLGKRVYCLKTTEAAPLGSTLCASLEGNPEQIDIAYRFWELFDLQNIPLAEHVLEAWEESELLVTPPMRHFQEEKLNLALFHHHLLHDFWRETLSKQAHKVLSQIIPRSWIMDPVDLPPNAVLDAPPVGGRPITSWDQLGEASQKDRNLIAKLSGYHEDAWGARSVLFGSDLSREEWSEGLSGMLAKYRTNLAVLQEYRKPIRLKHPVFTPPAFKKEGVDDVYTMEGRQRLCPYYFVKDDQVTLAGVLATFCPADKKIIHGMSDAAMLPCAVVND